MNPMRVLSVALVLAMLPVAALGGELSLTGKMVQGGMILGRATPPAKITLNDKAVRITKAGEFVIGFGRNARPKAVLKAVFPNGQTETRTLKIAQRKYRVQRIDGLPRRKVTPNPKDIKRIRADNRLIGAARARYTEATWYREGFIWPAAGRISGVYGSQRILNGKPRRPHFGLDVAAPVGTPIWAAADGIISLAATDMFFTGGTLIIDHGHGISSIYMHLSAVHVKKGDRVKKGQVVAALGSTGRATGPHLDWRVNWFQTRLDPQLLVGPAPPPLK